jgi:hypothetical protein
VGTGRNKASISPEAAASVPINKEGEVLLNFNHQNKNHKHNKFLLEM